MAERHRITINGQSFHAHRGELLLDAALREGVSIPYDCRSGHCGTCCVRLVSGEVEGGQGAESGVVHACKCRVIGSLDAEVAKQEAVRCVTGRVAALAKLSRDVWQVGVTTDGLLPYRPGQYAQLGFSGFPSRPFSITHPISGEGRDASLWFHIRRMQSGHVTAAIGERIALGHKVTVKGPYGGAHFRTNQDGRLILVATNTGFAPIWSIAVAALRENPDRAVLIIAGARELASLYMGPALVRLAAFPNVTVVVTCSTPQSHYPAVRFGRPTDALPHLYPTDVIYVCGAPDMVNAVKSHASRYGATCHADPFVSAAASPKAAIIPSFTKAWVSLPKPASRSIFQQHRRIEPSWPDAWASKG